MKRQSGFALPLVLLALVLIGALATGAAFAVNQETRAADGEMLNQQAFGYAERVALVAIAEWSCSGCDEMPIGAVLIRRPLAPSSIETTLFLTRLDSAVFLVTGEAQIRGSGVVGLRRRVSISVLTASDSLGVPRAFRIPGVAWAVAYQM